MKKLLLVVLALGSLQAAAREETGTVLFATNRCAVVESYRRFYFVTGDLAVSKGDSLPLALEVHRYGTMGKFHVYVEGTTGSRNRRATPAEVRNAMRQFLAGKC